MKENKHARFTGIAVGKIAIVIAIDFKEEI